MNIEDAVARYIARLNEKGAESQINGKAYCTFAAQTGQKYIKIIQRVMSNTGGGVHAFITIENGDLFKPASYNAPAKGIRGNIITGWEALENKIDIHGSYLYRR